MSTPILATKLYIPPPRPKVVVRSRLIERLNEGLQFPILKRQKEALAIGYVIFRGALETFNLIAVMSYLAVGLIAVFTCTHLVPEHDEGDHPGHVRLT